MYIIETPTTVLPERSIFNLVFKPTEPIPDNSQNNTSSHMEAIHSRVIDE